MKTALFTNFSSKPFTGYWDGKPRKFEAGESKYLPDYLADHYAKHLTNRELLAAGHERATSPKRPEDVPEFMELFNKAYTPDEEETSVVPKDDVDVQIDVANKNREQKADDGPSPAEIPETEKTDNKEESFSDKPVDQDTN